MLPPMGSPPPSHGAWGSHLCAGCGQESEGISVGGYCASCRRRRERRAARLAQRVAILATLPLALYVAWALPPVTQFRIVMLAGVLLWYLAVRRIAKRVALEWMR